MWHFVQGLHSSGHYKTQIKNGNICIYSINFEGSRYTLELRKNGENYYVGQFRGFSNCFPPKELSESLNSFLASIKVEEQVEEQVKFDFGCPIGLDLVQVQPMVEYQPHNNFGLMQF